MKRDSLALKAINNKIDEIRKNPRYEYKHLHAPLSDFTSAHIQTHFILVFKIDHVRTVIVIYYYDHHDTVYAWREEK